MDTLKKNISGCDVKAFLAIVGCET